MWKKRPKRNETCESPWSSLSASPLREISQTTSHSRPPAPRPWSQRSAWSACHSCWREPVTVSVWYRDQIVRWSSPSTFGLVCWITSRSSSAGWESFFFFFRFNGSLHPAKLHYCHLPGFTATSSPKSSRTCPWGVPFSIFYFTWLWNTWSYFNYFLTLNILLTSHSSSISLHILEVKAMGL